MSNSLTSQLWKTINNMRGTIAGWDIKPYILGALFIKKLKYSKQIPITEVVRDINIKYNNILEDFDLNNPKLGDTPEERLKFIEELFSNIDSVYNGHIDFNEAYEYLLTIFNLSAAKSGGEFYTPPCVARLLAQIANPAPGSTIYDPTCGCGGLLIAAGDNCLLYGQELNKVAYNTCRMNLIVNNYFDTNGIKLGDTLANPQHLHMKFDYVLSNPPYSIKWDQDNLKGDIRFRGCVPAPKSKGDFAFILHSLYQLKETGKAIIVVFPGVLYRGANERLIRQHLVENKHVETVVQLPENIFYGTSISTCLLILSHNNDSTLFVNASKFFTKGKKKNTIEQTHIDKIADIVKTRRVVDGVSSLVSPECIKESDYNLSINSYVDEPQRKTAIDPLKLNMSVRHCSFSNFVRAIECELIYQDTVKDSEEDFYPPGTLTIRELAKEYLDTMDFNYDDIDDFMKRSKELREKLLNKTKLP